MADKPESKAPAQKAETKAEAPVTKFDASKLYTLIGNGKGHLAKGTEYQVYGADAEIIVKSGKATLKG